MDFGRSSYTPSSAGTTPRQPQLSTGNERPLYPNGKLVTTFELLLFFCIPIAWAAIGLVPLTLRHVVFQVFIVLLALLVLHRRPSAAQLGFQRATLLPALRALLPGMLIALGALALLYWQRIGTGAFFEGWWHNPFFLYYPLLGAASQEFAYRSVLLPLLTTLTHRRWVVVLVGCLLFASLHIFHRNPFTWVAVLLFGAFLNLVFIQRPNFYASWIAHAIVGSVAITLGFFSSSTATLVY